MYAMRAVSSTVFCTMMFPHEGCMVKLDQLTYHDPNAPTAPENVLPMVEQPVSSATTFSCFLYGARSLLRCAHDLDLPIHSTPITRD